MKNLILLSALFAVFNTTTLQAQVTKTLTKSIDLAQTKTAYVQLPGFTNVSDWDENFIKVTTTVNVNNMTDGTVKTLVIIGRYNIEASTDKYGEAIVIKMPKADHFVIVKGVDLEERYSFDIKAPKGYNVIVKKNQPQAQRVNYSFK